ncbi:carboxymuconolactone decarboxylase family protein [Pseudomonas turukhanskensis]|uniref:Alkyl hydroperoxide reductase AhpD n=1 Tax=Pseudomonas turukhanskensis TaxID=1806536 RepID=A0A9W6NGY3_9PSED|nr:carboxymuconolactone decarboxylase family protein [Pseudomonas turukhanskensis]GLK91284.1 alkyl hydroperoxide reductase AhpD [Pseudomonas turukhanskensis]
MSTHARVAYAQVAPHAFKALLGLEKAMGESSLEKSLHELVKIRASQLNGCAYCIDMHTADAIKLGETPRRIFALSAWHETPFFSERERAALLWTETLTLLAERGAPDAIYNEVAAQFNERELADLTFAIATINAWNRFGGGFAMQPAV